MHKTPIILHLIVLCLFPSVATMILATSGSRVRLVIKHVGMLTDAISMPPVPFLHRS